MFRVGSFVGRTNFNHRPGRPRLNLLKSRHRDGLLLRLRLRLIRGNQIRPIFFRPRPRVIRIAFTKIGGIKITLRLNSNFRHRFSLFLRFLIFMNLGLRLFRRLLNFRIESGTRDRRRRRRPSDNRRPQIFNGLLKFTENEDLDGQKMGRGEENDRHEFMTGKCSSLPVSYPPH